MTKNSYFNQDDLDEQSQLRTPVMARSRNQLASAYAPGAFFTFEGGLGACISLPDRSDNPEEARIDQATREQIFLRLRETWNSWFMRASAISTDDRPIDPTLCIDQMLLGKNGLSPLGLSDLALLNPSTMTYAPAPLTFVCNSCGLFKEFEDVKDVAKHQAMFNPENCPNPKKPKTCKWRQLDIIFVHWSGEWQPARPGMWEWDTNIQKERLTGQNCKSCNCSDFILHTDSPRIGDWGFQCANPECGHRERAHWLQNDRFTTKVLREDGTARVGERRMEPISYRASAAYYAQSEQFVIFSDREQKLLSYLSEHNADELANFIATKYGFGGSLPTEEEMKEILLQGGHDEKWKTYEHHKKMYAKLVQMGDDDFAKATLDEMKKTVDGWLNSDPPLVPVKSELPESLYHQIRRRSEFSTRYDPFVLAVEHEALLRSKIQATSEMGARAPFVRFYQLDSDLAPRNGPDKEVQQEKTKELMGKLGMAEFGLIREFELCRFTHGYSRVSPTPTMEKRGQLVPVRLRMFEPLRDTRRPIYVVKQANEALYVALKPELVYQWLQEVGMDDLPVWDLAGDVALGGRLLEVAEPFGRYFSNLHKGPAATYRYVYTLLHSMSHLFMKTVSEFSGLDLGSLGEYIFPADLSFVVYRNGTTMDLGNLSSLWRNENNRFLAHLLEPASHRCNSGSLCEFHGGACPDCIMVPETSCIAQNQLLSRAVLRGGLAPREDTTHEGHRIKGFLETVNGPATI